MATPISIGSYSPGASGASSPAGSYTNSQGLLTFGTPPSSAGGVTPVGGLTPFNYTGAYGGNPQLPDPISVTSQTNQANLAAGPLDQQLVTQTAKSNAAGASAALGENLPNYDQLIGTQSNNILSELEGTLPPDVMALLQNQSAERGVSNGSPGSPNSDASFLQSLGLTSLGLEQTGVSNLNTAIGETPTGPAVNTQSYQTPNQTELNQLTNQSLYNSAPNPTAAASTNAGASAAGRAAGSGAVNQPAPVPAYTGQQTIPQTSSPVNGLDSGTVSQLTAAGYSAGDIAVMTPSQAQQILGDINSNPIGYPSYTPEVNPDNVNTDYNTVDYSEEG